MREREREREREKAFHICQAFHLGILSFSIIRKCCKLEHRVPFCRKLKLVWNSPEIKPQYSLEKSVD